MNNKGFSKEGREEWYKTMVIYRFMANYNLAGDMEKSNACFDLLIERSYFKIALITSSTDTTASMVLQKCVLFIMT